MKSGIIVLWLCCLAIIPSRCFHCWSSRGTSPRTATLKNSGKHRQCACHPMTVHWMFAACKNRFKNTASEFGARSKKTASILKIPRLYGALPPTQPGSKSHQRCGVKLVLAGTCCCRCRRRFKSKEFFSHRYKTGNPYMMANMNFVMKWNEQSSFRNRVNWS